MADSSSTRHDAAERVRAFLDEIEALGLCGTGVLFGIPDKHNQLLIDDLRTLAAADSIPNPGELSMGDARIDARIEAVAKILFGHGDDFWEDEDKEHDREDAMWVAEPIVAAIDAVEAEPGVERLVAALEHASMVMRAARISTASKAPNTSELLLEEAVGIDDLVAEFGQQPTGDEQ